VLLTYDITGEGLDYNSGPYTVTFPAGQTIVLFNIPIISDDILEGNESFTITIDPLSLTSSSITAVDPDQATVTIVDDDGK